MKLEMAFKKETNVMGQNISAPLSVRIEGQIEQHGMGRQLASRTKLNARVIDTLLYEQWRS